MGNSLQLCCAVSLPPVFFLCSHNFCVIFFFLFVCFRVCHVIWLVVRAQSSCSLPTDEREKPRALWFTDWMYLRQTNRYYYRTDLFCYPAIRSFVCCVNSLFTYCTFHSLPLSSLNSFPTFPGMGRCIQEQSRPYWCGSSLWGAKEERHWIPCVRHGDPVTHTYPSAGRRHAKFLAD